MIFTNANNSYWSYIKITADSGINKSAYGLQFAWNGASKIAIFAFYKARKGLNYAWKHKNEIAKDVVN